MTNLNVISTIPQPSFDWSRWRDTHLFVLCLCNESRRDRVMSGLWLSPDYS